MTLMLASGKTGPTRNAALLWAFATLQSPSDPHQPTALTRQSARHGWRRSSACRDKWTHAAQVNFSGNPPPGAWDPVIRRCRYRERGSGQYRRRGYNAAVHAAAYLDGV